MDWGTFAAGLGVGVYLGWGYRRLWATVRHNLGLSDPEPDQQPAAPRLVVNATTVSSAPAPDDLTDEWNRALAVFALWGDLCGWSERRMCEAGFASRPSIRRYRSFMAAQELLVVTERGGTTWVRDWNRHKLRVSLAHKLIALPYPSHRPWPLRARWQTAQTARRSTERADGAANQPAQAGQEKPGER